MFRFAFMAGVTFTVLSFGGSASASDIGTPDPDMMSRLYPGKTFSPYAQRAFPDKVYWGETHLHTAISMDAGLFGATLGHEDAYRFALGEEVISSTGLPARLSRPLDWLVISDHSDLMGFAPDLVGGAPNVLADPKGKFWFEETQKGGTAAAQATLDLVQNWAAGTLPEKILNGAYVSPCFKEVSGKRMPQGVAGDPFWYTSLPDSTHELTRHGTIMQVVARHTLTVGVLAKRG